MEGGKEWENMYVVEGGIRKVDFTGIYHIYRNNQIGIFALF